MFKTLEWTQDGVVMIDQRKLPARSFTRYSRRIRSGTCHSRHGGARRASHRCGCRHGCGAGSKAD
jgi:hypothetical protein